MPRKNRFTREDMIAAALELTRTRGSAAVTARGLAKALGSSSKPIFGLFESMDVVQRAVRDAACAIYQRRIDEAMTSGEFPPFKASGMAYTRFAREEPELFRLLFMRDRSNERPEPQEDIRPLLTILQKNLGISEDEARRFHLEMWVCVHGIATMLATSYLDWPDEQVSRMLSDFYLGLKRRYEEENAYAGH